MKKGFALLTVAVLLFSCASCSLQKAHTETPEVTTMELENVLYEKVKTALSGWDAEGVYAVSFFIYSNEAFRYRGYRNVTEWAVSCNTEENCAGAGPYDEERWNYAFWPQEETPIIDVSAPNPDTDLLFDWYASQGIDNIGEENGDEDFDEDMRYIGKGPAGEYELIEIAVDIALRLRQEGFMAEKFGDTVPILIHGLEYAWYDFEATEKANPNGEADTFLKAFEMMGWR